ncbi:MAG: hypothetical protein ACFBSG_15800 [Leptolyngbyaceae cyanobacterium]
MWTTLLIIMALFLVAIRVFLTAHNQTEVISAGLVATACLMIALGVSPRLLKLALLIIFFYWMVAFAPPTDYSC